MCLAAMIKEICGGDQLPGRFGGDEFAILFTEGNLESYYSLLEQIQKEISAADIWFFKTKITVSIGLAMLRQGWDAEKILQKADEAMYQSKENGKNQITVF